METALYAGFVVCIIAAIISALLCGEFKKSDIHNPNPRIAVCAILFHRITITTPWWFAGLALLFFIGNVLSFAPDIVAGGYSNQ